ncbi:MAG: hypothetical protein GXY85_02440 [Candidatus Brocadiaceae bacterium]|nr:hypothetical protein [Candidatus Brocadiaceae bacterium]
MITVPVACLVFVFAVALFFGAREAVAAANHPNRGFTFEDRGPEVALLYRLGLENRPEHVAVFCEALKSDDLDVRRAAIAQLVFTHDESALDAALAAMEDESSWVRRGAIAVLSKLGDRRAVPALEKALNFVPPPPAPPGSGPGLWWWKRIGPESSLRDEEYFNRLAAALALHRLGSEAGVPTVLSVLAGQYPRPVVQMAAQYAVLMDLRQATDELLRIAGECEVFGEDSPGLFAIRALRIMGDPARRERIVQLARDKIRLPGGFIRMEALHVLLEHGDASVLPLVREVIEDEGNWREHQRLITEIIGKLRPDDGAVLLTRHYLTAPEREPAADRGGDSVNDGVFRRAAEVVAALGDVRVLNELKAVYGRLKEPADVFHRRLYLAYALAALDDPFGRGELLEALGHGDAGVRRLAARLLGRLGVADAVPPLAAALAAEADRATALAMQSALRTLDAPAAAVDRPLPPVPPAPADTYGQPRFLHVSFDDCTTIESMERFVGLIEELAARDVRWAPRMYVACLSRHDFEYCTMLLQRCFDRGCEFENHSLHHNPDGQALWARTADEVRLDCGGGANWLHGNIMGCDRLYHWKSGGGGFERPGDPRIHRETLRQVSREVYWARDIDYNWRDEVEKVHPDRYAPPYHPATPGAVRSLIVTGDLGYGYEGEPAREVIDAFVDSLEHWYFHQPEAVFSLEGHDWPSSPVPIRIGFEKHWEVLSGFLREVLLNRRERYPLLYSMTALEVLHVRRRGLTPEEILDVRMHLQNSPDF